MDTILNVWTGERPCVCEWMYMYKQKQNIAPLSHFINKYIIHINSFQCTHCIITSVKIKPYGFGLRELYKTAFFSLFYFDRMTNRVRGVRMIRSIAEEKQLWAEQT